MSPDTELASFEEIGLEIGTTAAEAQEILIGALAKIRKMLRANPALAEAWLDYLDNPTERHDLPHRGIHEPILPEED